MFKKLYEDITDPAKNMYTVLHGFIIAFNSSFYLNRITVLRSFTNTLEELTDISYFTDDMLRHRDPITTLELLGCVQNVASKKKQNIH